MNQHYTYFIILAAAFIGPFALSFDKKVAFYKKWKYLFPAMLLPALFFIIWDGTFATMNIWFFNQSYIVFKPFIYHLPLEEILFFIIVPYCCLFVYECVCAYFTSLQSTKKTDTIFWLLGFVLGIIAIFFSKLYYTFFTSMFLAIFIFLVLSFRKYFLSFNSTAFLVSYLIIIIPFLVVNGFLTAIPVITYNDAENLGLRIYSIPVEDIFYGMLLIMMNTVIYEKLKTVY